MRVDRFAWPHGVEDVSDGSVMVFDYVPGLEVVQAVNFFENVHWVLAGGFIGAVVVGWQRLESIEEAAVTFQVWNLPNGILIAAVSNSPYCNEGNI